MARTAIDKLDWLVKFLLTLFLDPIVQGVNRILRGRLLIGIIWIVTAGIFGFGWLLDVITVLFKKDITILA